MNKITIGISPCPNDTFIFEAIYNERIDLEGISFDFILEDVELLNRRALSGKCDVTKISYNAFTYVWDKYLLCNAGSALGRNCGPLLIAREPIAIKDLINKIVGMPGKMTTANLLLSIAYPEITSKKEMIFHQIEEAVISGEVDLGLIIHENRFTYLDKGLVKIRDLGEYWEETTGFPIPLGGIAVKRNLKDETINAIDRIIRKSVQYAFTHPEDGMAWIKQHSQEMDDEVVQQHIDLYVNDYSLDLGAEGRHAVRYMYDKMASLDFFKKIPKNIFVEH